MAAEAAAATDVVATSAPSSEPASEAGTLTPPASLLALDLVRETCGRFMRRRRTDRSGVIRFFRPAFVREMNARQLCLCLSLRALGFRVEIPNGMVGPLWAVADGLRLLAPLDARIHNVELYDDSIALPAGAYVLWLMGHFVPMRLLHSNSVQFPPSARLFRVVTGPAVQLFDSIVELAAVASEGRRRLRERLGREAGLILYLELADFPLTAWLRAEVFGRLLRAESFVVARDRELRSLLRDVRGAAPATSPRTEVFLLGESALSHRVGRRSARGGRVFRLALSEGHRRGTFAA